ncbi:MAG: haloalkane dehalogenase [Pseudomonadota bacterium]
MTTTDNGPLDGVVRTPDERFDNLAGFDFAPHYVSDLPGYEGLRVHYLDEGPADADQVFLCLHGEPSWSYLYRKMLPVFVESGARVIAPDWLGFGKSDKPVDDERYTFHFHRDMILALIEKLDLRNITLVVQDWGGVLGLTLPQDMPDRFSRLLVMNTAIATGQSPGEGFLAWKAYAASQPDMDVGELIARGTPHLNADEIAAYNAPYPSIEYKAGVRRFPEMVMIEPGMEGVDTSLKALNFWRNDWQGQSFMAIGAADPVLGVHVMQALNRVIRNCPEPMIIEDGGHFLQEWGEDVARAALASFASQ